MRHFPARGGAARAEWGSDIVLAGGFGFIAGLGPIDLEDDRAPLPDGVERQVQKIFANLDMVLERTGLGRGHVVSVRIWLVEYPRLFRRMNAAYAGFFPADRLPSRSCVGVSQLTRGAQVEMDFVLCTEPLG